MAWVERPWHDELAPTVGNAWWLFCRALRCAALGHRGRVGADAADDDWRVRICRHCGRKWEWEPAP
jgi:hypothetical protein